MTESPQKRIVLTGGSGKAGRACIADLLAHGYAVLNVDQSPPRESLCPFLQADLTEFGQTLDAFTTAADGGPGAAAPHPFDAIVHLAAIPAPRRLSDDVTFRNNTLSTYHVFDAARRLGIKNVVWASSETLLGLPFEIPPPYVPIDEEYPARPESAYSLTKLLGEEMAQQFCRWDPELKIIGLRFSNVLDEADYATLPAIQDLATARRWNLWSYIDARDAAQAVRKAIEAPLKGAEIFVIANNETVMRRPSAELLAEQFPGVPVKRPFGRNEALLSSEKAKRLLGFAPQHRWDEGLAR